MGRERETRRTDLAARFSTASRKRESLSKAGASTTIPSARSHRRTIVPRCEDHLVVGPAMQSRSADRARRSAKTLHTRGSNPNHAMWPGHLVPSERAISFSPTTDWTSVGTENGMENTSPRKEIILGSVRFTVNFSVIVGRIKPCLKKTLVRSRRLELPRELPHSDLNAARLPIPPRPHAVSGWLLAKRMGDAKREIAGNLCQIAAPLKAPASGALQRQVSPLRFQRTGLVQHRQSAEERRRFHCET